MESPRFVLIPCRSCRATTVVLGERRRPKQCARCRAPYDANSASFAKPADSAVGTFERPPHTRLKEPSP